MANARFNQFMYTKHGKPVRIDVQIPIGATGAVGTLVGGSGISSVTRLAAGTYKIKFVDNYNRYLGMNYDIWAPGSGSDVAATALNPTSVYAITALGTTTTANWVTAGLPVGITPAVGAVFLCAATSSGTGTGQVVLATGSGLNHIEVMGDPNKTLFPVGTQGGYIVIVCYAATNSSTTTLAVTDPANGSKLSLEIYLSDSSNAALNNG